MDVGPQGDRGARVSDAVVGGGRSRAALDMVDAPVAIVDASGSIVAANHRFDEEFGDRRGERCCDVLGCRRGDGGTARACVTDRAFREGNWRGLVWPSGSRSLRELTLARFEDTVSAVLENAGEAPGGEAARAGDRVTVFCLGSLRVGDPDDAPSWLDQRPGALFKYLLAMRHRPVSGEEIAESLWPGSATANAGTVRYVVHQLRARLEPYAPEGSRSRFVLTRSRGYQLDDSAMWIDVDEFEQAAGRGVSAVLRGDGQAGEKELLHAVGLYRGDFLRDDPFEEWSLPDRDRLARMFETVLELLIERRLGANDLDGAAEFAERLAAHEPLDPEVQRLALELWLMQGRRGRALRHYELFRVRLWRAFGEAPPFDLADLLKPR